MILLFYIVPNLAKIGMHAVGILTAYYVKEFVQFGTYPFHLFRGTWVEQDFLKQIIVFVQNSLGYCHVAFECCTGRILVFHHCSKYECRNERY